MPLCHYPACHDEATHIIVTERYVWSERTAARAEDYTAASPNPYYCVQHATDAAAHAPWKSEVMGV